MNRRIGKMICAAGAVAAMVVPLAACGGGNSASDRPENEIHVYVLGDAAASAEEAVAERFNKTSDVKVVVDKGPTGGSDYLNTIRSTTGTKDGPDIFMSWSKSDIEPLMEAGAIKPLDEFIEKDAKLKDSFLPAVFEEQVVDGKTYGIPMRGTAPNFLFYNKQVLADNGLEPAKTWDELVDQVKTLKDKGLIPIAISGAAKWAQQQWYQYLFTRLAGNDAVAKGLAGDESVWKSAESKKALEMLRELVDAGAFGNNYDSVQYTADGSPALVRSGKAAYELMGTWYYADETASDEANEKNLGYTTFPTIDGAKDETGLAGNLANYYNVAANTKYPEVCAKYLAELYSDDFQKDELNLGNLPPTVNAADLVAQQSDLTAERKEFLSFVSEQVGKADSFQLSWDQVVGAKNQTPLQNAMADYFNGTIDADAWISQMVEITKAE